MHYKYNITRNDARTKRYTSRTADHGESTEQSQLPVLLRGGHESTESGPDAQNHDKEVHLFFFFFFFFFF